MAKSTGVRYRVPRAEGTCVMPGRIAGIALALLLISSNVARAACAWVLWQELTIAAADSQGLTSTWEVIEASESKEACTRRAALTTKAGADYMKSSNDSAPRPD